MPLRKSLENRSLEKSGHTSSSRTAIDQTYFSPADVHLQEPEEPEDGR